MAQQYAAWGVGSGGQDSVELRAAMTIADLALFPIQPLKRNCRLCIGRCLEMTSLRDRVKGQPPRRPGAQADPEAFITRAEGEDPRVVRPWEALDKQAVPRTTFNLRLNAYQLTLLRGLADQRDESMQKLAKRLLIPALEQLAAERPGERS